MASLDREDQRWLMDQFTAQSHEISGLRSDLALTRQEVMAHISSDSCRKIRSHEAAKHDIGKSVLKFVGLLASSVGALVGIKSLGWF